jgi:hypothetical protein
MSKQGNNMMVGSVTQLTTTPAPGSFLANRRKARERRAEHAKQLKLEIMITRLRKTIDTARVLAAKWDKEADVLEGAMGKGVAERIRKMVLDLRNCLATGLSEGRDEESS